MNLLNKIYSSLNVYMLPEAFNKELGDKEYYKELNNIPTIEHHRKVLRESIISVRHYFGCSLFTAFLRSSRTNVWILYAYMHVYFMHRCIINCMVHYLVLLWHYYIVVLLII